ncbi:Glycerophosphoryl diester phosphodiesterase family protein [Vibrio crassostreae]|uniref:glycerophosphodiester phosphodiesterase family protein n=1 Tax=Vibrio crassostreae TaxID=246167 RepID=UPI000F48C62E|nr:glycerophosphodiester phosphodiesterase family protein [Vibrio crassostreae]ROR14465.1 glycerophosphoryl diester phosphodiesterase family protein [Vibrio crassostreae]CAK2123122.1 Glycerophosphoryl diester phosphodiesterase family protein [Vibrio crassostreae]CAK2354519.1 Glycerophosphoryl diester phosphodiesterase family protein [Vibrio crassostreae]CAK2364330.1 Glycerophosphoryl diester phosphodiesterase family protein [Vibrio crassostreae]CAK3446262.1 Glycerophosphoryl diester phosphodie
MILKGIRVLISIFCLVLICFWVAFVIGPSMSVVIDVWRGNVKVYPNEHNNISEIIVNSGGLIAHAGGGINGLKYTNSLEAMEQSIEHGFKMIELDLLISSDGRIVAVHDWKSFHEMTNSNNTGSISYKEFESKTIYDKYKTLNISTALDILDENNVVLVTDKIKNLVLLSKYIIDKDKSIIEVFSTDKYNEAIELGFNNVALNIDLNTPLILEWIDLNKIKAVTYRGDNLGSLGSEYQKAIELSNMGVSAMIYSTNDLDLGGIKASGIGNFALYVDFVLPSDER